MEPGFRVLVFWRILKLVRHFTLNQTRPGADEKHQKQTNRVSHENVPLIMKDTSILTDCVLVINANRVEYGWTVGRLDG